jgi:hypothetical protein
MSNRLVCLAGVGVMLSCAGTALGVPVYSFEELVPGGGVPGPDGFFGLGAVVSQETDIGVTHLEYSMKYTAGGGGFVGARTESVPPSLNNPPGVEYVLFDLHVPELAGDLTFADIGVTVFGHDLDNGVFGIQNQFTDVASITALGVGQHHDVRIDLDAEFFSGESFNELFGDDASDMDVASAFQFFISKNAGVPLTIYIDNVRFAVPAPGAVAWCGVGAIVLGVRRRRSDGR